MIEKILLERIVWTLIIGIVWTIWIIYDVKDMKKKLKDGAGK